MEDHFKTSDERFEYTVYSSRFGFSVGRKKKQGAVTITNEKSDSVSMPNVASDTDKDKLENQIVRALENHIKKLENLTSSVDNLIYCLCANTEMGINIGKEKIIKQ